MIREVSIFTATGADTTIRKDTSGLPRVQASRAQPDPVAPPPIIRTS